MTKHGAYKEREGPMGVELVRMGDKTVLNVFSKGLVSSSHVMEYKEITMPEALVWLATKLRLEQQK